MADNIEDLDLYIENFLQNENVEEDDFDFFDFLTTIAFLEVAVFTAQLKTTIERYKNQE